MENWKSEKLAETYLEGVRAAIPFVKEQLDILLLIIKTFKPDLTSFMDLGCGDGVLGQMILSNWDKARGILVDYSEPMIKAARTKNQKKQDQLSFVVLDFGNSGWFTSISQEIPVDVVVSGFSIHHQPDVVKKRVYHEIFNHILKPGGVFLNLDQVKSPTKEIEAIFDDFFMDSIRQYQNRSNSKISVETIGEEFNKDKKVNILTFVDEQCSWLREIGFSQVDCYFKAFEMAIFGGIKPK